MKEVKSNSVDVVVSTLVLCSVKDLNKTLTEVQRVLALVSLYGARKYLSLIYLFV